MRDDPPAVLVQLGDLHIGADWTDHDPLERLSATVDAIRRIDLPLAAVLVLGDLAEHAAEAEYANARALLGRIGAPVHVAMGNRDDRERLRRSFELAPADGAPLRTGSAAWDRIALDDRSRSTLARTLGAHPQLRAILAAHLHRPLSARFADRPLLVCPSTYAQFPLRFDAAGLEPDEEPPGYVAHVIGRDAELLSSFESVG